VAAAIDSVVEEPAKPAAIDEQPTATDGADEETPETPLSLSEAIRAIGLEDMTRIDLAVLVTARHRTVRRALKAAAILARRAEWHHLEECADMLCWCGLWWSTPIQGWLSRRGLRWKRSQATKATDQTAKPVGRRSATSGPEPALDQVQGVGHQVGDGVQAQDDSLSSPQECGRE
jgi:hypothetical protein